ncbi:MAG: hypothetical protein ACAI34_00505 [Verrucomicrobium sp.]
MKQALFLASIIAFLAGAMVSCVHPGVGKQPPKCGFADPETSTNMGICYLAAEYYMAHNQWPATRAQLDEQSQELSQVGEGDIAEDEAAEIAQFLRRFDLLDLQTKKGNLVMHYRFTTEGKVVDQTVTLHPRPTVDEILQSAKAGG